MNIAEIKIISKSPLVLATSQEIQVLESRLWITFPAGYLEYITRFGEGTLSSFIRIYPPWRIEAALNDWRRRINKFWFWDAGADLLPMDRALECVILGDTLNGDELAFHPMRPDRLFVLPHGGEMIFDAGNDVLSAIEWMCSSGKLVKPFKKCEFESFDSRKNRPQDIPSAIDPEGETLDDIVELGRRWAKRHVAKNIAENRLSEQVGSGRKAELLYESIIIDAPTFVDPGYSVAWRITEKQSGTKHGTFYFYLNEGSQSQQFEPAT